MSKLAEQNIDIAIFDLNTPRMNSMALSEKLKSLCPNAGYSLITANIQDTIKERADKLNLTFIGMPITKDKVEAYLDTLD